MNHDYLWDRTGEPDPEIQRLERILGTLRYQPRPLELPAKMPFVNPRTFLPRVAIAAAVAAILVGGTSWLLVRRPDTSVRSQSTSSLSAVKKESATPEIGATAAKDQVLAESRITNAPVRDQQKHRGKRKSLAAGNRQLRITSANGPELSARDRAEARAAKEQLLLALRVASEKLSLAQKRAQATYPGSPIRNHHKAG
jgi:hypothetical protein